MAECKFYSHAGNLLNRKINIKTRILMLNSLVRSRILYSCQTWCITQLQMQQMNSQYLNFIRKMVNGEFRRKGDDSWSFFYSNEDILRIAGATDLTTIVKRLQRGFLCQIVQKANDSIIKRLIFNSDRYHKRGPHQNLLSLVLKNEEQTLEEFLHDCKLE